MHAIIREKLPRLLLTLLLALGLALTMLGLLRLNASPLPAASACVLAVLVLETISLNRRSALWGFSILSVLFIFWLVGGTGPAQLTDLFRAVALQTSGISGALPLMAEDAAVILALILTLLSFLCCRQQAGSLGAVLLTAGLLLLLWLENRPDLIFTLIPAAVSALTLLLLDRHPENSLVRILPWVAATVLLAGLLTPREGLLIPSLKEKADTFRQAVMDRLFFTEPRDVFSLSSEGFYPQGISQLGGPVSPSDHPVMQVSAPREVYLRGVIMNEYDGRSWRNTLGGRRYLWDAASMAPQRSLLFDQALPAAGLSSSLTKSAEISVRMLGNGVSTLFVPQRLRDLRAGGELVPYFTNSTEIFATRNLQSGDTWSAFAPLFMAGDPGLGTLVDAAGNGEDPQWSSVLETYTLLPPHLEEPVWQLAADVTSGLSSSYEKAFALQNYLSRNYRYTLDVSEQSPRLDFVTSFLFGTREGYCTYFASAMTVLCRMIGLPARYVEGYLARPNAQGEALITGMDAHAWTEVYFSGFGWLTFDATPRQNGTSGEASSGLSPSPEPSPPVSSPTPAGSDAPDPESLPSGNQETGEALNTPAPENESAEEHTPAPENEPDPEEEDESGARPGFPWLLLLLLLVGLIGAGMVFRWLHTSPLRRDPRLSAESDRFDLWLDETILCLSAAGYSRTGGETIMGFTRRIDSEKVFPLSLAQLGECASLLHYGKVTALETDTALAREAAQRLKKSLSRKAKLRYAAMRISGNKSRGGFFSSALRKTTV